MPGSVRRTPATSKQKRLAAAPAFFVGAGSLGLRASGRLREAVSEAPNEKLLPASSAKRSRKR